VVGKIFELKNFVHLLDAVNFRPLVVVNVDPFLLRRGKHVFCVKPSKN
jgi:hypothetical protein